jgi:molybdenum cofactor synthesis domain-containing protein
MKSDQPEVSRFTAAILIASDRSYNKERPDSTGPKLINYLEELGYPVIHQNIVPDNIGAIISMLQKWVKEDEINLILVAGGTGLASNDVTPEATLEVIERRIPGMEEAMRRASFKKTPYAILSRGVVGCAGQSLIINLPGSPKGALDNIKTIQPALQHALELITGEKPDP